MLCLRLFGIVVIGVTLCFVVLYFGIAAFMFVCIVVLAVARLVYCWLAAVDYCCW